MRPNSVLTSVESGPAPDDYGIVSGSGSVRWTGRAGVELVERIANVANGGNLDQVVTRKVLLPPGLVANGGGLLEPAVDDVLVVELRGVARRLRVTAVTRPGVAPLAGLTPPIQVGVQDT